jgi:hypothetical protein
VTAAWETADGEITTSETFHASILDAFPGGLDDLASGAMQWPHGAVQLLSVASEATDA